VGRLIAGRGWRLEAGGWRLEAGGSRVITTAKGVFPLNFPSPSGRGCPKVG
jgi:hypothetical protein